MGKPDGDETVGPPPTTDLVPRERLTPLLGRVLSTYGRRLWALLVVAALPAFPVVLLAQVLEVAPLRDGVLVNGVLESTFDPLAPLPLVVALVLALLGLLIAPVCLGGATLLGAADLLGRWISPRQAWREALRRYFTILTWLVLVLALVLGTLALFLWMTFADWPPILSAVLVLGLLASSLVPLTVSLPLALLEGHGPFRALLEAWRMARRRFGAHLLLVGSSWAVTVMAGTGLERALVAWTDLAEGAPGTTTITVVVGLLVAPLSLLLGCAPVAYSGGALLVQDVDPVPTRDLDLERVAERLPPSPNERAGHASDLVFAGPRSLVVPALVLAVFAPPLMGPALVALNPFGLAETSSHPIDGIGQGAAEDEGTLRVSPGLLGYGAYQVNLIVCDPECLTHEVGHARYGASVHVEGEGAVWAAWREYGYGEGEEDPGTGHQDSGLYLMSCADASDCAEPDTEVRVRAFAGHQWDLASSVVPLSRGGLLVASHARFDDHRDTLTPEDPGGARLHLCEDVLCADPEVVALPAEASAGGFLTDGEFLTAAASPTGGYAVALSDVARGSLSLAICAQDRCEEPTMIELRGDRFHTEHESRLRPRFGARVEYRSDGSPVLAYRDPQGGRAHLVDCHDTLCSDFTDTVVGGQGWARPVPGLAVDSQDRAHLLTPDFVEERLTLSSCLDRSCSRVEETPLLPLSGSEPFLTALALDERDRPHMVWGEGEAGDRPLSGSYFTGEARYLRCADPYCGADLT